MPLSMVVKEKVKKSGYHILAWALQVLIAQGQHNLVAMIIVALCLAPRKTELENNGVLSVLRNFKLRQNRYELKLKQAIEDQVYHHNHPHFDKIGATLAATGWWASYCIYTRYTDPTLSTDDSCMFFNSVMDPVSREQYQDELCDHAGCQREYYFPHYRLVLEHEGRNGVRVIGRQMDRWHSTEAKATRLPNEYFEYRIPSWTVLCRISNDLDGRTLSDVLEPGVWYNYRFLPDTPLDLVDHEAEQQLAEARQGIANAIMQFGALNG